VYETSFANQLTSYIIYADQNKVFIYIIGYYTNKFVSSANFSNLLTTSLSMSLIKMRNNNHPKMDPCGIPLMTYNQCDTDCFSCVEGSGSY